MKQKILCRRCCMSHVLCDPSFPRHPPISLLSAYLAFCFLPPSFFPPPSCSLCVHTSSLCAVTAACLMVQLTLSRSTKWRPSEQPPPPTAGLIEPDRLLELSLTHAHIKHAELQRCTSANVQMYKRALGK